MQRDFILTLAVLGALLPAPVFAAEARHSATVTEVPLMPGMEEQQAGEAPIGTTASTTGVITGNRRMVISYYNETLRAEGWTPTDPALRSYQRDGQTLNLQIEEKEGKTTVTFLVTGKPKETRNDSSPSQER